MRNVSNTNRPACPSKASGKTGSFTASFTGQDDYKDLIDRANTVSLLNIFKHYGLRVSAGNRKIICPFKAHKNGRENTASFEYYPHTDTFWCHGCNKGTRSCNFVANMENVTVIAAAYKILDLFSGAIDEDLIVDRQDSSERLEIMLDFSAIVREFRTNNLSESAQAFIENMCEVYDSANLRHNLDNDALKSVVSKLKEEIISYTPCQTL